MSQNFHPCSSFQGSRPGFVFHRGDFGVGYYRDKIATKRKLPLHSFADDSVPEPALKKKSVEGEVTEQPLSKATLLPLLQGLEKHAEANAREREAHPEDPLRYLDSEELLNEDLTALLAVASLPELYPVIQHSGSLSVVLDLLHHSNPDICRSAVQLLAELTTTEGVLPEEMEVHRDLLQHLCESSFLEQMVQYLRRSSAAEDAGDCTQGLGLLSQLLEIDATLVAPSLLAAGLAGLLASCLARAQLAVPTSEVVVELLASEPPQEAVSDMVAPLLEALDSFSGKNGEEREVVENLGFALCSLAQRSEDARPVAQAFHAADAVSRLLSCARTAAPPIVTQIALQTLSLLVATSASWCAAVVGRGGLKLVFPYFLGRGLREGESTWKASKVKCVEFAVSIVATLLLHVPASGEAAMRVLLKLAEKNGEKLQRALELYSSYSSKVAQSEAEIAKKMKDSSLPVMDEFEVYSQRLTSGLFTLQKLALIVAYTCHFGDLLLPCEGQSYLQKAVDYLSAKNLDMLELLDVLREQAAYLRNQEQTRGFLVTLVASVSDRLAE